MKHNFTTIAPDFNLKNSGIKAYIKLYTNNLIIDSDKKLLTDKKIDEYLKDRNNRLLFLKELNEIRAIGKFELNKDCFIKLGHLMIDILTYY